jgi:hypothetical protein
MRLPRQDRLMPAWFWILVVILLAVFIGFLARRSGDPARRQPVSVVSEPQRDRLVTTPERSVHAEAATPAGGGYAAPMATEVPAASAGEARIRTGATVASATAGRLEEHPPTELADEATGRADEATGSADQPDTRADDDNEEAELTEEAQLTEEARERGDEGYVETFGNERDDGPSSEYGPGSANANGPRPGGWMVKGNADSMLFYTPSAPSYARARADVWFRDEAAAIQAGFVRWDAHHR